jgi:predicted ferric reductase
VPILIEQSHKRSFVKPIALIIALCILTCWVAMPADNLPHTFFYWRALFVQLSGMIAITLMSFLLVLVVHPRWIEQRLGGLDKLYKQHKYAGISAGGCVLLHWFATKSPHLLASLNLLPMSAPHKHSVAPLRGIMLEFGEIAFYGMVLFLIFSLVKAVPYRNFKVLHKTGAILALFALIHSAYLIAPHLKVSLFGISVLAVCLLGAIATLISLSGRIGKSKKYPGQLLSFTPLNESTLAVDISVDRQFAKDYQPGKFALVSFEAHEGAHPFTIVNYDPRHSVLTFAIKSLGDYTQTLKDTLQVGMPVTVEGPYGRFVFQAQTELPIYWVAGGIGITPFISWLNSLSEEHNQFPNIHLIYCVRQASEILFKQQLQQLCSKTNIKLTIIQGDKQGHLDVQSIKESSAAQYWFCGPVTMRNMLIKALGRDRVHYENFEFR